MGLVRRYSYAIYERPDSQPVLMARATARNILLESLRRAEERRAKTE